MHHRVGIYRDTARHNRTALVLTRKGVAKELEVPNTLNLDAQRILEDISANLSKLTTALTIHYLNETGKEN